MLTPCRRALLSALVAFFTNAPGLPAGSTQVADAKPDGNAALTASATVTPEKQEAARVRH